MCTALLKKFDLLADVFESGQNFNQCHVVGFCDCFCHICGNDRLNESRVLRHGSVLGALAQDVLCDQHTGHISGEAYVLAGLAVFCINAETICVRVGCKDDVSVYFFCQFQRQCPCFLVFRVRVSHRREVSVRHFLLFYNVNLIKAKLAQNAAYRHISGSVKRCVDDLHIFCRIFDDFRMNALLF